MSNISSSAPGVVQPLINPYPAGSNSARTAGIAIQNDNNRMQTNLIKTAHGGKRNTNKKGGATSQIAVPTMQVLYPEPGAGNQTVNGNISSTTTLGASSSSNSIYDSCIGQGPSCTAQVASTQKGGYKKRKTKGGLKWGCYSGGTKRNKRKNKNKSKSKSKSKRKSKSKLYK
jgi:hypothetical protein